MKGNWRYLD